LALNPAGGSQFQEVVYVVFLLLDGALEGRRPLLLFMSLVYFSDILLA
jgi:hypothetical protein